MNNVARTLHVRTWNEFRRIGIMHELSSIAYATQRAPTSKPPIGLRLIFTIESTHYVFLDFAKGDSLKQTKIPIQTTATGEAFIDEETIRNFLGQQLNRKDLKVVSFEVLGY